MSRFEIPVSAGELVDKLTILEIKSERISEPAKLKNIRREHDALAAIVDARLGSVAHYADIRRDLRAVNEELWAIEDDIRDCERRKDFGPDFIALARAVYRTNDRRAALKRAIDDLVGSEMTEEKSYQPYD